MAYCPRARGRERLLAGASLTAAHYVQATRFRQILKERTLAAFHDLDVAITASSMDPACRIDDSAALTTTVKANLVKVRLFRARMMLQKQLAPYLKRELPQRRRWFSWLGGRA